MQYQDPEQKRKMFIIGSSVAAAILILIIGIWAVTAALNSVKGEQQEIAGTELVKPTEPTQQETVADYTTPETPDDEKVTEQTKPVVENTVETPAPAPVQNDLPDTGPEDLSLTTLIFTPLLVAAAVALLQKNSAYVSLLARK